jgi:hypothetical protein
MTVALVELVTAQPAASTGAAAWMAAALVTGALPSARSVVILRRRATLLTWLVTGALTSFGAALLVPAGGSITPEQAALLAAPLGCAALVTLPLLGGLRAAASAFAPAPGTPTPPALRTSAANPLLAVPVQVAALAAAFGAMFAADLVGVGASLAVPVTLMVAGGGAVALGTAVRHGRLREQATRPARTFRAVGVGTRAQALRPAAHPVAAGRA